MATYLANRRTREIGIRKCQGATPADILRLLLWDFSKPVVWANLAAVPLVVIALDRYLSLFAEPVAITPLPFALALAATWLLACAVTATGIRSPMASLLATGPRPLLVIGISTLTALVLSVLAAGLLLR